MLKKEIKRKILLALAPRFAAYLLKLIYLTCRVRFYGNKFPKTNAICACWHGEMLMLPFCYLALKNKEQEISVIVSSHFDGKLISKTLNIIGGSKSIKGSTSKGGVKALRDAMEILKKPNNNLAISPDGPRGPRHSVADGVVALSQKLNAPVVVFNCRASSFWQFKSWDKMFLPKPFSKIDFYVSEPLYLDNLSLEEAKKIVKDKLMENAHE